MHLHDIAVTLLFPLTDHAKLQIIHESIFKRNKVLQWEMPV